MSDSREKRNLVYLTYLLQISQARIILHLAIPFSANSILPVALFKTFISYMYIVGCHSVY